MPLSGVLLVDWPALPCDSLHFEPSAAPAATFGLNANSDADAGSIPPPPFHISGVHSATHDHHHTQHTGVLITARQNCSLKILFSQMLVTI